jgi:hypothetical protein
VFACVRVCACGASDSAVVVAVVGGDSKAKQRVTAAVVLLFVCFRMGAWCCRAWAGHVLQVPGKNKHCGLCAFRKMLITYAYGFKHM